MFDLPSPRINISRRWACTALTVVFVFIQPGSSPRPTAEPRQIGAPGTRIDAGRDVVGHLTTGASTNLWFYAEAGDFLHLRVEQYRLDLSLELFGPRGHLLQSVDNPEAWEDPEEIKMITAETGDHRLEIRHLDQEEDASSFRAELVARRPAEPRDHKIVDTLATTLEAEALRRQGKLPSSIRAEVVYRKALDLWRDLRDRHQMGHIFQRLGRLHHEYLNQPELALTAYQDAIVHFKAVGHLTHEASAWEALGKIYTQLGDSEAAAASYQRALPDLSRLNKRAFVLNELGLIHHRHGELYEARRAFEQALELWRQTKEVAEEAATLHNRGKLLLALGKIDEALDDLTTALRAHRLSGNQDREAASLAGLGDAYLQSHRYSEALDLYQQALALQRSRSDRSGEARSLNNIGLVRRHLGEWAGSEETYRHALAIYRDLGDRREEARTLHNLAKICLMTDRAEQALELLTGAQSSIRGLSAPELNARLLLSLAEAEQALGRGVAAYQYADKALSHIESLREQPLSYDLRAAFFARKQGYYEFFIDLSIRLYRETGELSYLRLAFEGSERARARSFLDLLHEQPLVEAPPPQVSDKEQRLARSLEDHASEHLDRSRPQSRAPEEERQLRSLLQRYDSTRTERRSARHHFSRGIKPLTVSEIQSQLDSDSLLLHYDLGPERSYLWAMTSASIEAFELPPRDEIERLAHKAHGLLSDARLLRGLTQYALQELSDQLLKPVEPLLEHQRLLISADGALQYLPFGALPHPSDPQRPLLVRHVVIAIPSASVAAFLARRPRKEASGTVALVADAVFDSQDPRVSTGPTGAGTSKIPTYNRLVYSRHEAEFIAALVPDDENKLVALDFDARKDLFTEGDLADYGILHIATHGEHHVSHPELSRLVLSLVNHKGESIEGSLYAYQIYNLDLNADLVVLSACGTGLGQEVSGEGLVGLPRAFFAAGARHAVVSLWNVADRATSELMGSFYQHLLEDGLHPAEALQQARMEQWRRQPWPAHWAAFIFQGPWDRVEQGKAND